MGHAFCFNPAYPKFQTYKNQGYINDPEVVAYQGTNIPVDAGDHLSNNETIDALKFVDRVSKKGAFGSEYAAFVPYGRWLITKLNLLCFKAIGYSIKQTSAFKNVSIVSAGTLPDGTLKQPYAADIIADGGIPFYKFEVTSGSLPAGLSLNSFTGHLSGTPGEQGNFAFTLSVTDYDNIQTDKAFVLNINSVLPVKLTDFKATKQTNCLTEIIFATATENNAFNFEIQKGSKASGFLPLKVIPATGSASSYQFFNKNCNAGIVYYRLKLIDKDGDATFSKTVSLDYSNNGLQLLMKRNVLDVTGCEPGSSIRIGIFDVAGRVAGNQQRIADVNGSLIYDLPKLSAGIYTVIVRNNQRQKSLKVFIQ